jgi:CRP-like cAMP-binding protein
MSILDVQPRSATVKVLAPTHLLRITAEALDSLYRKDMKSYTLISLNIARELSRRLRVMDALLSDIFQNLLTDYVKGAAKSGPLMR